MTRGFLLRIAPSASYLTLFLLVPLGILFAYSLGSVVQTTLEIEVGLSFENYERAFGEPLFREVLVRSLVVGLLTAVVAVVLAYPLVYAITLGPLRARGDAILLVIALSLFAAFIVRVYAWRSLLGREGVINQALTTTGIIDRPLDFLLYSQFAVTVTLVNVLLPVAALTLYSSLSGLDHQVIQAARTLGASRTRAFLRVTLPLSARGVQAAFAFCFILAASDYVTPTLVGSSSGLLIGNIVAERFGDSFDWPLGAALALTLVAAIALVLLALRLLAVRLGLNDRPREA